jgi:cobalt-zinc-cadmium efflux system outer membrane protein
MSRTKRALCLTLLAATAVAAHSQETLTETEYLAPLSSGHPALVALSDRLAIARAESQSASLLSNPELDFEREAPSGTARQSTWSIHWSPPLNGRRGLSLQSAGVELDAAQKDLEAKLLELRSEMRADFASWLSSSQHVAALSSHLELIETLAERIGARAENGEDSKLSARRMELAAIQARAELSIEKANLVRARAVALAWRPELSGSYVPLAPDLPAAPSSLGPTSRPALAALRLELEGAELERRLAGRSLDSPRLQFGWQDIEDGGLNFDGPVYGIQWRVPLFSRGQAARLQADQKKRAAQARLDTAVVRAERNLEGVGAAYEELASAVSDLAAATAELDTITAAAETSYRLGESSLTDLLDSLQSVLSTRLSAVDLYSAALEAHRNLETAAGRPLTTGGTP